LDPRKETRTSREGRGILSFFYVCIWHNLVLLMGLGSMSFFFALFFSYENTGTYSTYSSWTWGVFIGLDNPGRTKARAWGAN
jgi:hypothetical protein